MVLKPRIVDDMAEALEADFSFSDVSMAVHARTEIGFGIVQMKSNHLPQTEEGVYFADNRVPSFARADVVTGREQMTRIQANG